MTEDIDLIPPTIDPKTKKLGIRSVRGANNSCTRTDIKIRTFDIGIDEPENQGGGNTAPTPLELLLASLIGCEGVMIHHCAAALQFKYSKVEFQTSGEVDLRGPQGVPGIRPYFERVKLTILVYSNESEKRFASLSRNVEHRCPVMNLFRAADVNMEVEWVMVSGEDIESQQV